VPPKNQSEKQMKTQSPITRLALMTGAAALFVASGSALAGPPGNDTSIQVLSDPVTVSVSRNGGPTFYVNYTVTVGNNSSNNTQTYDFKATTKITGTDSRGRPVEVKDRVATFVGSSGIPCTASSTPEVVTCAKLSIDKDTTKSFTLTYKSPLSAAALENGGKLRLTVESTSKAIKGSGYVDTILVTQPYTDITLGFETFVTEAGGTFYTGFVGNGCGPIPGSWPSATDPFTTTLYVPPINFTTTAKVYETPPSGESCSELYTADGCFESDLTIPSAPGAFESLKIYLRIGPNKIKPGANIANAVLKYTKEGYPEIDVQACTAEGPSTGNPCIRSRRAYGVNYPTPSSTAACNGVWEFLVEAVDNGLYRTR
jgi:hypothetical protein